MEVPDLGEQLQIQIQNIEYKQIQECRIQFKQKTKNIDRTDDIIAGMLSNKTLNPIRTNLFNRKKTFVFITQIYFAVLKNIKLNATLFHYKNLKQARDSTCCV